MTSPTSNLNSGTERKPLGADLFIPALAGVFTVYFLISTAHLSWEARINGMMIGYTLLAFIAFHLLRIIRRLISGQASLRLGSIVSLTMENGQRLAILALFTVYVLTIDWIGTTLGLFLTLFASMWILEVRSWRTLFGVSAVTSGIVYVLFIGFLKTRLPQGPVENLLTLLLS